MILPVVHTPSVAVSVVALFFWTNICQYGGQKCLGTQQEIYQKIVLKVIEKIEETYVAIKAITKA